MAYQQYSQWTPMYSNQYASTIDYNANWQTDPQQFAYKPTAIAQTLEIDDNPVKPTRPSRRRFWNGLKSTLRVYIGVASLVLGVNVGWLVYAKTKYGVKDGYGTIHQGNCADAKQLNIWLHLLINVLSTLLLTGSNVFMATYSGPTRREVDKAHARRRWLHIGFMSLRNMRGIAKRKSLVVLVLALSSVPFHLLYNSVVFTSLSTNGYYWAIVSEDFLTGAPYSLNATQFGFSATSPSDSPIRDNDAAAATYSYFDAIQNSAPRWEKLDRRTCIQKYSNAFVSTRRNVVLVSSTQNETNSVLRYGSSDLDTRDLVNNWWICSKASNDGGHMTCNPEEIMKNANAAWDVWGYPIDYCMSEKVDGACSVQFSMKIMIMMISFNALKLVAMVWILFRFDVEEILASVGDAAASFIKNPDPTTSGMCLADRRAIENFWRSPGTATLYNGAYRRRRGAAITKKRWILFFLLMLFSFGSVILFGLWGFIHTKNRGVSLSPSSLWNLGFGSVNQFTMALYNGGSDILTMSILANIPQIFLAMIYLMFTGIMTAMFNAVDWSKFAARPRALMVSIPKGRQRGTWLLGAPLWYGVGLLTLQALLHWFVSQSFFVVQIVAFDRLGQINENIKTYSNCGYSPIAIIFAVVACLLLVLAAIISMMRRLPAGSPPIVSTCSAAISAACHVPPMLKDDSTIYNEVRWGVSALAPNGIGHCSLVPADRWGTDRVGQPVSGWAYAGLSEKEA